MNQNFNSLLLKHVYLNLQKLFHNSSYNAASHYDTLKLQRNCSSKQIRDAFIKLSKENHPDINKSPNAHKEFLKIQEAYNVLSKPELRANYDLGVGNPGAHMRYKNYSGGRPRYSSGPYSAPFGRNPWDDPPFYYSRDRSQDTYNQNKPYYGVKGINKMSNGTVAFFIMTLTAIVFIIQMTVIRHTFTIQQSIMNNRSALTQQLLNELRAEADKNGNKVQMEIHKKQFEEAERLRKSKVASKSEV